jgi:hypothetical protein
MLRKIAVLLNEGIKLREREEKRKRREAPIATIYTREAACVTSSGTESASIATHT